MRKLYFYLLPVLTIMLYTGCSKGDDPKSAPIDPPDNPGTTITYTTGYNFIVDNKKVAIPDADKPVTIAYKAPSGSALYGEGGDMYLYSGIGPAWEGTPSSWTDNNPKYKMSAVAGEPHTWSITLPFSLRSFYHINSNVAIQLLNLIVRNAAGNKQTGDYATLVIDSKNGFTPKEINRQAVPLSGNDMEGIHLQSPTSATLVLYDQDAQGKHKDHAFVVGDFNSWQLKDEYQMNYDESKHCWWITLDKLSHGKNTFQYFVFSSTDGGTYLGDPYSEEVLEKGVDSAFPQKASGNYVSVIDTQPESYHWQVDNFPIAHPGGLVIYELLLRDFTTAHNLAGAKEKLPYLKSLGINAIELMPVQEFGGSNSWGYDTSFYFALDRSYGTLKEYKEFVDACHRQGIAVLFDVVYNHTNAHHPFAKMYWDIHKNCPATTNPWFNAQASHTAYVFGIDFNHESDLTRTFVKRNLKYLLENYHIDGFRFDFTKGFTQKKTSTDETLSAYDADRVAVLEEYAAFVKETKHNAIVIMEHFVDSEESELGSKGILTWRNMNNSYCQAAMGYQQESGFEKAYDKHNFHISYMESHDEERMAYKQDQWGIGTIKGNLTNSMHQLAANATLFLTVPGPKMIWEFGELGYNYSINSNASGSIDEKYRTEPKPIRWEYYDNATRRELHTTYSILINIRNAHPELFDGSADFTWHVAANDWNRGRTLYLRSNTGKQLVVMANFNARIVSVAFPAGQGIWKNVMTDESTAIGSTSIDVPAHSFYVFSRF